MTKHLSETSPLSPGGRGVGGEGAVSAKAAPSPQPLSSEGRGALRTDAIAVSSGSRTARLGGLLLVVSVLLLFAPPFVIPEETFRLGVLSKYLALAILALSIDLIWGYTGLLSLGQGVYFGLGAYAVAYCLTLQQAALKANLPVGAAPPEFMAYTNFAPNDPNYVEPAALAWIAPLGNVWVALAVAVLVPAAAAALFGGITFRLRIKGVYFSLITQALLLAFFILVNNQQRLTGGVVGIKSLADLKLFGVTFNPYKHVHALYFLIAGGLTASLLLCAALVRTKFGKVLTAIRDNENRVLALGYPTAGYKTFIFAVAGGLGGLAGALYVVANALCGPAYLSIPFSIEAVIWVAVGGRGTLIGPVIGAVLVGTTQSYISSAFPDYWLIVLGLLFIGVVVFLPHGLTAVAGRGALPGSILGVTLVDPFVTFVGDTLWDATLTKPQRVLIGCPFILLMVFLPKLLAVVYHKADLGTRVRAVFAPSPRAASPGAVEN